MAQKYTEAQKQCARKWDAANLDRLSIALPKGSRETIKAHAAAQGESTNGFIKRAIDHEMERDLAGGPQGAAGVLAGAGAVALPSETVKAAQEAAQAAGEDTAQFICRAVETQVQNDIRVRLNEERQEQTTVVLVREIEDTARLVTSTLWCNVAYNGKLYKKPKDAQEVRAALVECKQSIVTMLDSLIEKIGPCGDAHSGERGPVGDKH